MRWRNSPSEYGAVTKAFHWLTALLVISMICIGYYMGGMPLGAAKLKTYNLHKSLGATVLIVTTLRILWHIFSRRPKAVETLKPFEKLGAGAMHYALYALLLAMPLTGWFFSSAFGRPVSVFGLFTLPDLIGADRDLGKLLKDGHETLAVVVIAAAALHALAALGHHFFKKDTVLRRMLPFALALLVFAPAAAESATQWNLLHDKSSITFHPRQMGQSFDGAFDVFAASILFDEADLANSKVKVTIQTGSAHTGAADRDENLKGEAWLNVAAFPEAVFTAETFRKTGEAGFEADGTLTVRNVSLPVTLPFTLKVETEGQKKTATMDAHLTLDRSKLGLGTGDWADTSIIANEVPVDIHVTALAVGSK